MLWIEIQSIIFLILSLWLEKIERSRSRGASRATLVPKEEPSSAGRLIKILHESGPDSNLNLGSWTRFGLNFWHQNLRFSTCGRGYLHYYWGSYGEMSGKKDSSTCLKTLNCIIIKLQTITVKVAVELMR